MTLVLSNLPTAYRLKELASTAPDSALRTVAKHLDLPMEDAETVSFLRHAFNLAENELRVEELQWRMDQLKEPPK